MSRVVYCFAPGCSGHVAGGGTCPTGYGVCCGLHGEHCGRHEFAPVVIKTVTSAAPSAYSPESILQEAHRLTHGPRRVDYGHPLDDYGRTAALFSALIAHKLKEPLTAHEMALGLVCVKLSREMNHPKRDNSVDGAGYFWVAHACLEEAARRANQSATTKETK